MIVTRGLGRGGAGALVAAGLAIGIAFVQTKPWVEPVCIVRREVSALAMRVAPNLVAQLAPARALVGQEPVTLVALREPLSLSVGLESTFLAATLEVEMVVASTQDSSLVITLAPQRARTLVEPMSLSVAAKVTELVIVQDNTAG